MERVLGTSGTRRGRIGLTEEQVERIAELQRDAARRDYYDRITLDDNLATEHREVFIRALKNVLATELALFTFAQIIDGLPVADVGFDRRDHGLRGDHPLDEHEELCAGAMEKARELEKVWDPSTLKFNPELVRAYQSASQGSKQFNTRLVELVALAIHQLAVQVFKMKLNLHHHGDVDSVVFWVRPKPADWEGDWHEIPPRPTIFNHPGFHEHDIYPEAEADMVGYWVEDRILGGVPAFDRKAEAESSSAPPNIYFHACRRNVTQRIFQLRDDQQQALTRLLLADSAPGLCPLLILGDKQNHVRIDAHEAIIRHQVYRDLWERTPWTREEERRFKRRPKAEIDYPQMREMMESINSLPLSAERIEFSESGIPLEPLPENARFSTPGTQNEESEAQGNMSEAEVEVRASGSVRGKDPAERERSQDTSGFTEAKAEEPASKGPPSKGTSDTALDKGPRGGNGPQEAITSAETEAADSTAFTGGEALDKGSAVDALGYKSETYSEAGSSDSMSGEGRGGKRRRLN